MLHYLESHPYSHVQLATVDQYFYDHFYHLIFFCLSLHEYHLTLVSTKLEDEGIFCFTNGAKVTVKVITFGKEEEGEQSHVETHKSLD